MLPLLVVLSDVISLYGAYMGVNMKGMVSLQLYTNQVFGKLGFGDVIPAIVKSVFFGFVIGIIGCFKGYNTTRGTEGVGKAANNAVILSTFMVFILDLVAAQITDIINIK